MQVNFKRPLFIIAALTSLILLFIFILRPDYENNPIGSMPQTESKAVVDNVTQAEKKPVNVLPLNRSTKLEEPSVNESNLSLTKELAQIKAGTHSVINLVFSEVDLNQTLQDLLALDAQGESWVNYTLGQIVDTCGQLHQRSEPEIIEMFTAIGTRGVPSEQQNTLTDLMPIVINAAKRCRSIDTDLLTSLGDDARSWYATGAEEGDANSYVIAGYGQVYDRLLTESEAYKNSDDDQRWKISQEIREQARSEFRDTMRQTFKQQGLTPDLIMNISEHLNLFYAGKETQYKQREAWQLLACDMGYENNCSGHSTTIKLMCLLQESCQPGASFTEGVLWSQGQFKLDEYQQTANELRRIIENEAWDQLGF